MRSNARFLAGVALALYPVACETTVRAPASGGSAGVLVGGRGAAPSTSEAGEPSVVAGAGDAPGDGNAPFTSAGASSAPGGSAAEPEGVAGDERRPGTGGHRGGSSSKGGTGSTLPGGTGERGGTASDGGGDTGLLPGSGEAGDPGGSDPFSVPPRCTSGIFRDPNESEGPEMNPGMACNQCHVRANVDSGDGDAPVFAFGGTVYPTGHEPSSCVSLDAQAAAVIVTDAAGTELTATVNAVGNFFLEEADVVFPITARIVMNGRERQMEQPVPYGDCNLCHTQDGARVRPDDELPPGRIVLP